MSTKLRHIDMFSGNTILGDGAVIMIVDPNGIAQALGTQVAAQHDIADEAAAARASNTEQLTSLLVFRAGSAQPKAVPLSLVTRLEEIAADKIEMSNGRYMVQYREQLMPLVTMEGVTVATSGAQPILVFADEDRAMGLVVDEIVDIVEEHLQIEVGSSREGILGSAVIKGSATEVIDVGHFLPMAFADWFKRKEMKASLRSQSVLLGRRQCVLPQHAGPGAEGRGLSGAARHQRPGRPRHAARRPGVRRHPDRHRDAGHERLRVRRDHPRRPEAGRRPRSSGCPA